MSVMGYIEAMKLQWYAVRMKQPQNRGRRTAVLGGDFETYRDRQNRVRKRRVKDTGHRVFVPEHLLRRAGFEVFLPIKKEWRRKNQFSPDRHLVAMPLMADWMFVGWAADQRRWHDLMALDAVAGVMGTSGQPVMISEAKVQLLQRRWGGKKVKPQAEQQFSVGDLVRVDTGPLEGHELRIQDMQGGSVRAMLKLLGRDADVEIEQEIISLVQAVKC